MIEKRYWKLQTAGELQHLMQWHYVSARHLRLGRPLAWVTSGAPVEILRAMHVAALYPENYAVLCATRREAVPLCQIAEARGYAPDLCSYARTHLGTMFDAQRAPMHGLPRPDLLVACNNICGTVFKWYEAVSRFYRVPLFVLDTPFLYAQVQPEVLRYVAAQLQELVHFVKRVTGHCLDMEGLQRTVHQTNECVKLWSQVRALCRAHPSPLNAPDLFLNMAPIVVLRGTRSALAFYRHLKAEVEQRVQRGVSAISDERYRLLWDNIAIWHHLYGFHNFFADLGACFVVDTYTGGWSQQIPAGDPLQGIAMTYATVFLNQSLEYRVAMMVELIRDYDVDGFVMHCNRSCKPYSLGQYVVRRAVMEQTGVPGLLIESDMCDGRSYAEEALRTRIQAFMETLAAR